MHRIDHSTAAVSIPTPNPSGSAGYFSEGNPSGSVPATIVTADWANSVQEEILGVVLSTGLTPSKTNNAQLLAAIIALGGNFAGVVLHAAGVTLGSAHVGRINSLSSNTSMTLSLPLANSVSAGKSIAFIGAGASAVLTVARSGTDYIADPLGTSTASIALLAGDTLRLVSDGVDRWIPVGGSAALARSSGVFGRLLSTNGYQKLPGGLIMQWLSFTSSASADITVTHPITFPNSSLSISISAAGSGAGYFGVFNTLTASNCKIGCYSATATRVAVNGFALLYGY